MIDFKIGKPYSFRGYNCWDYVADIRKQNDIKTRQFQPTNINNAFEIITAEMQKLGNGFTRVTSPADFDVVIGYKILNSKYVYHCGLFYQNNVLHCDRGLRQVVCESYSEFKSKYQGVNLWR